jgi:hypothetical protein
MPLALCPVLARKILFEENRPTGVLSSPEYVSMGLLVLHVVFTACWSPLDD